MGLLSNVCRTSGVRASKAASVGAKSVKVPPVEQQHNSLIYKDFIFLENSCKLRLMVVHTDGYVTIGMDGHVIAMTFPVWSNVNPGGYRLFWIVT